jgi:uncharacterized spore protein YtfJ
MAKKLFLILLSAVTIGMVAGCSSGDDGGPDPNIPLNDPNSKDQPTAVTGAGGGGGANTGATKTPSTD